MHDAWLRHSRASTWAIASSPEGVYLTNVHGGHPALWPEPL